MIIDDLIQQSATLQFSLKAQELKKQGRDIISLGLGEPDFDTPAHIKQATIEALLAGMTRYSAAPGLPELRALVAQNLWEINHIPAEPEEIVITPGAKNALFIACAALLRPGDEVINFTPCYVSYVPILKLAEPKCVIHNVPLLVNEAFRLDRERIMGLINANTRLVFINYPHNPTGKMLNEDDLHFLCDLLVQHPQIYLLSDEIYHRLLLTDKPHFSPAACAEIRERVITVNGFSKTYAMTGWRIGFSHATRSLTTQFIKIHQQLNTNTAAFIQKGAAAALTGTHDYLVPFIERLQVHAKELKSLATALECVCAPMEGGFFGFLRIARCGLKSDEFATRLLDATGVAVIPGVSFGADFDEWVRVSLVSPTDRFMEGLARIQSFIEQYP